MTVNIKTSDLKGIALDWAVAKSLGLFVTLTHPNYVPYKVCAFEEGDQFNPSSNWYQGGPIIERERLGFTVRQSHHGGGVFANYSSKNALFGETYLEAAMRCYVTSKLGDEVAVPQEIISIK